MLTAEELKKVCAHYVLFFIFMLHDITCNHLPVICCIMKVNELSIVACALWCVLQTADLVNANATEEEKVKAMISQSAEGYDSSQ